MLLHRLHGPCGSTVGIRLVQSNCSCSKHGPNLRPRFGHRKLARGSEDDGAAFAASSDATQGIRRTPKIPPWFDGTTSWFEYEDLIDDWLGITTLTPRKHGPSLKNFLVGSAAVYKNMFDNTLLRDADQGQNHFKLCYVLIL